MLPTRPHGQVHAGCSQRGLMAALPLAQASTPPTLASPPRRLSPCGHAALTAPPLPCHPPAAPPRSLALPPSRLIVQPNTFPAQPPHCVADLPLHRAAHSGTPLTQPNIATPLGGPQWRRPLAQPKAATARPNMAAAQPNPATTQPGQACHATAAAVCHTGAGPPTCCAHCLWA